MALAPRDESNSFSDVESSMLGTSQISYPDIVTPLHSIRGRYMKSSAYDTEG